jgi:hypothetical protein
MKEIFEGRVKRIVCGTRIRYTVGYVSELLKVKEIHIYRERNGLIRAEVVFENGDSTWVLDVSEFQIRRNKPIDTDEKK